MNGVCRFFAKGQQCKFGAKCIFSHGDEPPGSSRPRRGGGGVRDGKKEERSAEADACHAWKLSLKHLNDADKTSARVTNFFREAAKLVEAETGIQQEVVRGLAEDNGLRRIEVVIEQRYAFRQPALPTARVFSEQLLPLFRVITHPDVLVSAVLEDSVAQVFRYLHSATGQRFLKLLKLIVDGLKVMAAPGTDVAALDAAVKASVKVILEVIESLAQAAINTDAHAPINEIGDLVAARASVNNCSADAHDAAINLARIQKRLCIALSFPNIESTKKPATTSKAKFTIQQLPPGNEKSRRHDNDHEDICEIAILPTPQEIASASTEYLPVQDLTQNHFQGLDGLLDRSFRLLREDTVGQLRDAVRDALIRLSNPRTMDRKAAVRIHIYNSVNFQKIDYDKFKGIKITVSFEQPVQLATNKQRKDWWLRMRRLEPDSLVCIVDEQNDILFCTVNQNSKPMGDGNTKFKDKEAEEQFQNLYKDKHHAQIVLHLAQISQVALRPLVKWVISSRRHQQPRFALVEFPGVLLPAFQPTLQALQKIKKTNEIAMADYIVPQEVEEDEPIDMQAPTYATRRGFRFNLKCLTLDDKDLFLTPGEPFDVKALQDRTTLDDAQAIALQHALLRKLALIQGPPGTGKSFVGVALIRTLLANKLTRSHREGADIGPIIVVCYTNHALDGTLESLHRAGVDQIVRIGGRSKSEVLEDCNLRALAGKSKHTKTESATYGRLMGRRDVSKEAIDKTLKFLNTVGITAFVKYMRREWPDWANRIFGHDGQDEDGFTEVQPANVGLVLNLWLQGGPPAQGVARNAEDLLYLEDATTMTSRERHDLAAYLKRHYIDDTNNKFVALLEEHNNIKVGLDAIDEDNKLRVLRGANVIGITTSGLARQLHLLRKLSSKVLVCEEAGEVLEPHLLTTFLPSICHAILIGDHEQLRPQVQNYDLSSESYRGKQYSLDISLFERLIHPGDGLLRLPYSTLASQRRMHPSISRLIRETLYPALQDAGPVADYPEVVGMRKRLYWLDHRNFESGKSAEYEQTSSWNQFEVDMTTALVRHLISQGKYEPDDIAVLTPYLGQLQHLKQELGKTHAIVLGDRDIEDLEKAGVEPEEVVADASTVTQPAMVDDRAVSKTTLLKALRIATVDNFQGEEAKVVVISVVRSNAEKRCGFLKTSNRINVALSRAKHGMYIIGDANTASAHVEMWSKIVAMLSADGHLGPNLELQCPRHPDTPIAVATPDDFLRFSPEGGCDLQCADRLKCGHKCICRCHSNVLHEAVRCVEECPRPLNGCSHVCPNVCGDPCPKKCIVNVYDAGRHLPCGHAALNLPCWQTQADLAKVKCPVLVERFAPGCKHNVTVACHIDTKAVDFKCPSPCNKLLPCGHPCRKKCRECLKRGAAGEAGSEPTFTTDHGACKSPCGRKYTNCAHSCVRSCHGDECLPCDAPCDTVCSHSKCSKKCSEPCTPCAEPTCASECPHSKCTVPCAVPCNNLPCSKRCAKMLNCGHQCPSICSEPCPDVSCCQVCGKDDVLSRRADLLMFAEYRDVDLDDTPCLFPSCGHFYTVDTMDGHMAMHEYFDMDADGKVVGFKPETNRPFSQDEVKKCADCRASLRSINRYGRLVRRAMIDEASKRFQVWSNAQYVPLALEVEAIKGDLECFDPKDAVKMHARSLELKGDPELIFSAIQRVFRKHHDKLLKLRRSIAQYCRIVRVEEQPFQKVLHLAEHARRSQGIEVDLSEDGTLIHTNASLKAVVLLFRCDLLLITEVCKLRRSSINNPATLPNAPVDLSEARIACVELLELATASKNIRLQAELRVFFAQHCALERQFPLSDDLSTALYDDGMLALKMVKAMIAEAPNQLHPIVADVEGVELMLREGTFYQPVSNEEMKAVVQAMAREFGGTGHWYYCVNGHPFTIGECGGAMQLARCPECNAQVGGQHHRTVEGVTRATDIEQDIDRMRI